MAKLIVSDPISFDPDAFSGSLDAFNSATTEKADDDLWRVSSGSGEAFVRGHDFAYDEHGSGIGDDELISGSITSFSFNAEGTGGSAGPALVRIRGLDDLSAAKVHDAIESGSFEDALGVLRTAFKGDDFLQTASGNDYLLGFKGDDKIRAGAGEDILGGGRGQDKLYGGGDSITGDGSTDRFIFANGDSGKNQDSADRVYDFVSGQDFIDLGQTGGSKSEVNIEHDSTPGHEKSIITLEASSEHDKMVIVVVDNDHVHKSDLSFLVS